MMMIVLPCAPQAMDFFGSRLPPDPYVRFDTFGWSALNTFLVLTGENWPQLYHACAKVSNWASFWFVTWLVIGEHGD
jgi:hypothetical protein